MCEVQTTWVKIDVLQIAHVVISEMLHPSTLMDKLAHKAPSKGATSEMLLVSLLHTRKYFMSNLLYVEISV